MQSKPSELTEIFIRAKTIWQQIAISPDFWLESFAQKGRLYVAGGAIVRLLGDEKSRLWWLVENQAVDGCVKIMDMSFSLEDLRMLGDFYRWLKKEKNLDDACVDERLDESVHSESGVHNECGAGGALGALTNQDGKAVENEAATTFGVVFKQPLLDGLEGEHYSPCIYIDFSKNAWAVMAEKRVELVEANALSFNVSLPVEYIEEFLVDVGEERRQQLIEVLFKWNVVIPQKIILGDHNCYREVAKQHGIIVILDRRGVGPGEEEMVEGFVDRVGELGKVEIISISPSR